MDESQGKKVALFRYGVISDFVNQVQLPYGIQEELIKYKCSHIWNIPNSHRTRIARSTLLSWIKRYNDGGKRVEALYPYERNDRNKSRVIDKKTVNNLFWLVKNTEIFSVKRLLQEMNRPGLINRGIKLRSSTVYRFLHQNNLMIYFKNRKKFTDNASDNTDKNRFWLRSLLQGKIRLDELKEDLCPKIPCDDIEILYNCVLNSRLYFRNRAVTILSIYKGISQGTIKEYLFIPRSTQSKNFKKYQTEGVSSIISDKGKRLLKHKDPQYVDKVFSILHSPPSLFGFNRTSWRQEDIQKVLAGFSLKASKIAIKKIIDNSGYKYRKARTVLTSNDPQYKEKVQRIKDILSNLGPKEKFFSIDEYGPFAIKLHGGKSLVPPGSIKTVPQWQKHKGSIIITAALELSTNQITHFYSENKNTAEMIKLLNILTKKYSEDECIYFSWDAASWHASKKLYRKVEEINGPKYKTKNKSPNITLAPLPTGAQFLNIIESVFSGMAKAIIHNSDYISVDDCKTAIDRYFSERNDKFKKHPKRAGKKIWGKERVKVSFSESNNCKDPMYR